MDDNAVMNAADSAPDSRSSPASDAAPARHNAGHFKPGNPGYGLRRGKERADPQPTHRVLRDMMHVYSRPEDKDRTEGQKHCRAWLKKDQRGFMSRLTQLAAAQAQKKPPQQTDAPSDEEFTHRLKLADRREDPNLPADAVVSLLNFLEGSNRVSEVLFTIDEIVAMRQNARSAGLPLWEWMKSRIL
jgi:hypothetical protein